VNAATGKSPTTGCPRSTPLADENAVGFFVANVKNGVLVAVIDFFGFDGEIEAVKRVAEKGNEFVYKKFS
jgi:hypothetical protein